MTKSLSNQLSKTNLLPLGQYPNNPTGKKRLEIFESFVLSEWYKEYLESRKENTPSP